MIKQVVTRLLKHRHFWRDVGFDELGEIYSSMMLRSLAINLTGIFVPVYMLKLHYSLTDIITTFFWYFAFRAVVFDGLAGYLTGRLGPKHTIITSYALLIVSTAQFLTLPYLHWPLWLLGGIWGGSTSIYFIPFHTEFSKIKHRAHSGKELGYANIVEKSGAILGPVCGGVVASLWGGQYIFLVAMAMLIFGSLPLLRSAEPIPMQHGLHLSVIKLRSIRRDVIAFAFFGIEATICVFLWPLYLAYNVLTHGSAYARLGFLASVSVIVSMVVAYSIGKLADAQHGRQLLRFGVVLNALIHMFRPFVGSYASAVAINAANEGATVAYRVPFLKGMYDAADHSPSYRIAYFTTLEMLGSYARAFFWLLAVFFCQLLSPHALFSTGFFIAATASLLISMERFRALNTHSVPKSQVIMPSKAK